MASHIHHPRTGSPSC